MLGPPLVRLALGGLGGPVDWRDWFGRGLVVLVIACPCALVIATPVAVVSGLAAAARRGILIKGGEFLEEFGRLRVLAFDKTGTLTRGEPDVVEVVSADGRDDDDVLRIAAALGDRGGHVLGRAIARHARGLRLRRPGRRRLHGRPRPRGAGAGRRRRVPHRQPSLHRRGGPLPARVPRAARPGRGGRRHVGRPDRRVRARWAGSAWPTGPGPRPPRVLAELHALGLQTVMLTGDNPPTAAAMARELGIGEQRVGPAPRRQGRGHRRARRPARADRHGRRRRQRRPRPGRRPRQRRPGRASPAARRSRRPTSS